MTCQQILSHDVLVVCGRFLISPLSGFFGDAGITPGGVRCLGTILVNKNGVSNKSAPQQIHFNSWEAGGAETPQQIHLTSCAPRDPMS